MSSAKTRLEYWLKEILPLPTAPFHEEFVIERIRRFAADRGLKLRGDRAGNLLLEYRRGDANRQAVAFTCHMDHPGFEVLSRRGDLLKLRLLGGVDEPTLRRSRIRLYGDEGPVIARVKSVKMAKDRRRQHTVLTVHCEGAVKAGDWGHFDLVPLSLTGGKIRSKALDNVLSVALILALMDGLSAARKHAHVYGVFTVAEEVGFVGAMEFARGRLLSRRVPMVVMETSRELPSFKIGEGPVVRVGDRISVYDDEISRWISDTAEALARKDRCFRWQRALMPGGACEATLYQLAGWRAGALAVALANYHNMGPRGAAAEWVNYQDALQMLQLLEALAANAPRPGSSETLKKRLYRQHKRYEKRFSGKS